MAKDQILIIKLSALGDFILSLGAMKAIRAHHKDAKLTLLTTKPFEKLAKQSGYFDAIIIDTRPKWHDISAWLNMRKIFRENNFTRIYDLQNNDRTALYYKLLKSPKPEWVGSLKHASHFSQVAKDKAIHAFDRHANMLKIAGIENIEIDRLDWMDEDIYGFTLKRPYVLLVPGCAPQHPYKRWPAEHFAAIAQHLVKDNIQPVLIGTKDDQNATSIIASTVPAALDLTGKTTLTQITTLARSAAAAIGNDTGPMHIIAPTGCPSLSLFSGKTDPVKHAPIGETRTSLQANNIADITPQSVLDSLILRN